MCVDLPTRRNGSSRHPAILAGFLPRMKVWALERTNSNMPAGWLDAGMEKGSADRLAG